MGQEKKRVREPQTNVRLRKDEKENLDKIAKREGLNRTALVRKWISDSI